VNTFKCSENAPEMLHAVILLSVIILLPAVGTIVPHLISVISQTKSSMKQTINLFCETQYN
jgi:hypothetical protein